ncbi:MAG TPA: glycosyltransferase [Opitutaceae bacterium]|jgi:glycosyltransferase involved in cell wall biosynthesis
MIYFDTTSASSWHHSSGLMRVSSRLFSELGGLAVPATWPRIAELAGAGDWILTPELFSEEERPGFSAFLEGRSCRAAAIFHDAIPLKHPDITWPRSVERHAGYMKLLAKFDRVWAISESSRRDLQGLWDWQGAAGRPPVDLLHLGSDWPGLGRQSCRPVAGLAPRIVSVGILEPRKNQGVLLDAFEELLGGGTVAELHLVGRVNPQFGRPLEARVASLSRRWPGIRHHPKMDDAALAALIMSSRATAFPSIAEGCGLPLLESLWMAVPCLCSAIAPLSENAEGGGCRVVRDGDWAEAIRSILTDGGGRDALARAAASRRLPTWSEAAKALASGLG